MKQVFSSLSLILALAGCSALYAQNKVIKEVPAHMIPSLEGKDLYREYCAVCHGVDAKGGGPAAAALKRNPTDLTQLARRNGGTYPKLAVKMSITNNGAIEHGTVEMPIWGSVFSNTGQDKDLGDMRIMSLINYIGEIQAK